MRQGFHSTAVPFVAEKFYGDLVLTVTMSPRNNWDHYVLQKIGPLGTVTKNILSLHIPKIKDERKFL
jgi:hypothetical protein